MSSRNSIASILATLLEACRFHGTAPSANSPLSAGPSYLSRLRPSGWRSGPDIRGTSGMFIVAAGVFLLVAGIGAATSYLGTRPGASTSSRAGADDETIARLKDYTRSIETEPQTSAPAGGKLLPDVNTMIEQLAARLKAAPDDAKGWRTLGWSYFHTARYELAAAAYARAVALDPNSAELKLAYGEAKVKASESTSQISPVRRTEIVDKGGNGPSAEQIARFEAMPQHDRDAAIRSMVDGLASRLERSPRDVDGWTRLMRSRIVLGEREVATAAFRKALDVFKDDATASSTITAAAAELGLKAE